MLDPAHQPPWWLRNAACLLGQLPPRGHISNSPRCQPPMLAPTVTHPALAPAPMTPPPLQLAACHLPLPHLPLLLPPSQSPVQRLLRPPCSFPPAAPRLPCPSCLWVVSLTHSRAPAPPRLLPATLLRCRRPPLPTLPPMPTSRSSSILTWQRRKACAPTCMMIAPAAWPSSPRFTAGTQPGGSRRATATSPTASAACLAKSGMLPSPLCGSGRPNSPHRLGMTADRPPQPIAGPAARAPNPASRSSGTRRPGPAAAARRGPNGSRAGRPRRPPPQLQCEGADRARQAAGLLHLGAAVLLPRSCGPRDPPPGPSR